MKHYSKYNRRRIKKKIPPNINSNKMWKIFKNFKCKFTACCKTKCSINVKDIDGDGIPDIIEAEIGKTKITTEL
tara:strand:- start:2343 stop:2564 length:222 start_codon:yes stop_codon:yes gene_type:complete